MTEIGELLSYRLHVVASLLERGAGLGCRREFGVSLWEWRSIALLPRGARAAFAQPPRTRRRRPQALCTSSPARRPAELGYSAARIAALRASGAI